MTPKRILFIIRSYPPDQAGGSAKSTQTLAEGLARRGHDVHVLRLVPRGMEQHYRQMAIDCGAIGQGKPALHFLSIPNIHWPFDRRKYSRLSKILWHMIDLYNPFSSRSVRRVIKELRPDIVNTSVIDGFGTSIFKEISHSGVPLVHTMRDYYLICSRSGMYKNGSPCQKLCISCKITRRINAYRSRYVDLFLANSRYVRDVHQKYGILNGDVECEIQLNINSFIVRDEPRELGDSEVKFGYIGRMDPSKGVDKLIESFIGLCSKEYKGRLILAGEGGDDYMSTLRGLSRGDDRIEFLGWVSPEDFYSRIDVLVCPSVYSEPLPRVIYEAYSFGLPVIASKVGGNPEIVIPGRSGEIYDIDISGDLFRKLDTFRSMGREEYVSYSSCALRMAELFAPDAVLDAYERRIDRVLK